MKKSKNGSLFGIGIHWQILIGLVLGVVLGLVSREYGFQDIVAHKLYIGDIFMRALKMIIVPLIVSSIITGITGIGKMGNLGRLGLKTIVYYLSTSLFAILVGLSLINIIKPGVGINLQLSEVPQLKSDISQLGGTLLGIIPKNPIKALVEGDMLSIIFFSILFGIFITRLPKPAKTLLSDFINAVFQVMMLMTNFVIMFAPIGVLGLTAAIVAKTGVEVFPPLAIYMSTVLLALVIHGAITLPLILYAIGKIRPIAYARAMSTALLTAFSTASSNATLPITMECAEKRAGVSNKVTSFVLPLGATINMDGTALYECMVVMFIAQIYGIELSIAQQFMIVVIALLTSIGAAGIPMASLVMITIILKAVGLPDEGIGYIIAVDRILDMVRTTVNVWSDSCGAVVIASTEGEKGLKVLRKA